MSSALVTRRRIGPWGTAARLVVGTAMVGTAVIFGVGARDVLLGLVAFPIAVSVVVAILGRAVGPIRLTGPEGHCLNCGLIVAAFIVVPDAALLFYGTSMLLAALRGYAGCELFAISNMLWRRDDQIGCPILSPVDGAEARVGEGAVRR
jgi:hypothetical protein